MPNVTKEENGTVVNVTYQLIGDEAALLLAYKDKEYLRTLSSAARKATLEHLHALNNKGKLLVAQAQPAEAAA